MPPTIDFQVFYSGKVQGVGFRYMVKQLAAGYEVVGGVKNLADGRVEVQVSGAAGEVEAFLDAIAKGQLGRHIRQVERHQNPASLTEKSGFEIWR